VFTELLPRRKAEIIQKLQSDGSVVAMASSGGCDHGNRFVVENFYSNEVDLCICNVLQRPCHPCCIWSVLSIESFE
jgi:hypothetical protein